MWWYPTVKIRMNPSSEIGKEKKAAASAKRMTSPDQRALVIFCTATKAKLPPVSPVK